MGCSRYAVVSVYQKWTKVRYSGESHGWPRLIDSHGERRLARVVWSNRRATVAQTPQEVNAGSDGKVPEYTVHRSLLHTGLHSRWLVGVPMLTPVNLWKRQQWAREHQNHGSMEEGGLVWLITFSFTSHGWAGNTRHQDALWQGSSNLSLEGLAQPRFL